MRLRVLSLAVVAGLLSQSSQGYVEDECKQYGGTSICVEPSLPKLIGDWHYSISNDFLYDNGYPYHTDFPSETAALNARNVENPDQRPVVYPIGDWQKESCKDINCDNKGNGLIREVLGTLYYPRVLGGGTADAVSTSTYQNFLADVQSRSLYMIMPDGSKNFTLETFLRTRQIQPPTCLAPNTAVGFSNPANAKVPLMCAQPPKPNRCDIQSTNNPIKAICGNPIDFASGNKTQSETDWQSNNSPLKITRTYNSLPVAIDMGDDTIAANGWQFQKLGQKLKLMTYELTESGLKKDDYNILRLFSSSSNYISPILTRASLYIDRPGQAPQRFYFNSEQGDKVVFSIDNANQHISVEGYLDSSWKYIDQDKGLTEWYNSQGQLIKTQYLNGQYLTYDYTNNGIMPSKITDNLGQSLNIQSDGGKITQITLPTGQVIKYDYDISGMLTSVQRPGYGIKQYIYGEPNLTDNSTSSNLLPTLMTGIIDENGKRYATFSYDSLGRGLSTEHANGTQKFKIDYASDTVRNVTDDHNLTAKYTFEKHQGVLIPTNYDDGTKSIFSRLDAAGKATEVYKAGLNSVGYSYNSRNLETREGNSYLRVKYTEWDATRPLKTKITEGAANSDGGLRQAMQITSFTYDDNGNALTKTITDPTTNQSRTWTYTYNANSQKLSETNPLGQVSQWVYDNKGNLISSTDAQGLVTSYSDLTADGKPQTITSPTGQVTKLTYDEAGRVLTQTVTITYPTLTDVSANQGLLSTISNTIASVFSSDSSTPIIKYDITKQTNQIATTSYQYDGVGQLIKTTLPDGQTISYTYDDAHRLIGMTDSLGNTISYTLNGAGDITQTDNKDVSGTLAQTSKQTFDALGRMSNQTGNNGQSQNYSYDALGNLTATQDALSRQSSSQYDVYNRKVKDIDANGQAVTYNYDALDQITTVGDSNYGSTTYTYNAFGEVLTTQSTDTGTTTNSYNDKGQLTAQTDGAGRVQNYVYDSKGRLINRTDSTGKVLVTYLYDKFGRVQLVTDINGRTNYQYNSNNQVIEKNQRTDGTQFGQGKLFTTRYHYTLGGQLDEIRYPSGQLVQYQYDNGILKGMLVKTTDGKTTQVIDNISYSPNGIKGYNWSQTQQAVSYQYDLDGRLTAISDSALQRQYQYDVGNRITNLTDNKANLNALFTHDNLDRLTGQNLTQNQETTQLSYVYNSNSNLTQKSQTVNGITQTTNLPIRFSTNQYESYGYDGSGKVTYDGTRSYSYNSEGRIERIQNGSVGIYNVYNALGQRVQKNSGTAKTYFVYDESGKLISESDTSGNVVREYVYLGNMPIAMLSGEKPNQVLQVHTDHLGTPRAVSDSTNQVLWRWEGDAFGTSSPQVATVKMPLRMAGQYADDETGLFYNYFRFYDPKTGRYVENDPIGLAGGMNRWAYVGGSPLHMVDPTGENPLVGAFGAGVRIGRGISLAVEMATGQSIGSLAYDMLHEEEESCDNQCGNDTRVQAIAKAQAFAMVSRKDREYFTFDRIGEESRGLCFNMLQAFGATHVGYVCGWQNNARIEDHPDGHPHQIGINPGNGQPFPSHHSCPHIHAYDGKGNEKEFTYKRGW